MLQAAKTAAEHITKLAKKLESHTGSTGAQQEEKFVEACKRAHVLRNYGIQLKILTSVKAASIEDSRDMDSSLGSLTLNLGKMVESCLGM